MKIFKTKKKEIGIYRTKKKTNLINTKNKFYYSKMKLMN